jgi:hypothetical protein
MALSQKQDKITRAGQSQGLADCRRPVGYKKNIFITIETASCFHACGYLL